MSNYINQGYLNAEGKKPIAKVINSNPRMEQILKEWKAKPQPKPESEEGEEEFVEGLNAETVEPEPELTPEMILEEARCKADQIMNDAHAQAVTLREQTQSECQALYDEQKQLGYNDGLTEAEAYLNEQKAELQNTFAQKEQELEESYRAREDAMEHDIIEAIASVLERTFGVFMEDKKDLMVFLVKKTLQGIENGNHFKIRVSMENADALNEALPDLQHQLGSEAVLEIHPESTFSEDDCIIETEYGLYHCGGKLQLDNLIGELKKLCL